MYDVPMVYGLEKEMMRTSVDGMLSEKKHPKALGSALTHPNISTDFSEAQLELITSPRPTISEAITELYRLENFCRYKIGQEFLWPLSMPPILPDDIPIAWYSNAYSGMEKTIYRRGLTRRYGANMQTVCGTHVNISFENCTTNEYFHMIRNFLREGWIIAYLFGASPAADISYFKQRPKKLSIYQSDTFVGEYATSLRMSSYGYFSKVQKQIAISYDGLWPYVRDLEYALLTPHSGYKKIPYPEQLNDHLLQIENEHYSRIRPKANILRAERPLDAIKTRGVEYLEVRALDLNPFDRCGLSKDQVLFIEQFLQLCRKKSSPPISKQEIKEIWENQEKVALYGRKSGLKLKRNGKTITLKDWAQQILGKMKRKWVSPEDVLSATVLGQMARQKLSHVEFGIKRKIARKKSTKTDEKRAAQSLIHLQEREEKERYILKGYECLELSTQLVIREALKRGIRVDVLDYTGNIIRLRKGTKSEIIKQATITRLDPLVTYFVQGNKTATKHLLKEANIPTPEGYTFRSQDEAFVRYDDVKNKPIVVKPNTTNFGIGITHIPQNNFKAYKVAVELAFKHDREILVEEEIKGKEHRFLVINNKVVAIARRIPANVTGDGKSSIAELCNEKNRLKKKYLPEKEHLHIGETEKAYLKSQKMSSKSIPQKGKTVYLRPNSNVSTGGDSIDVKTHTSYCNLAVKAAKTAGVAICGVDMLIKTPSKPGSASILELNYNPHLALHAYPTRGTPRPVAKMLLDALGF